MLDLETGERERLTTTPGWDYASALSPDGTHVAYVHEDTATRTLRVVDLDGGRRRATSARSSAIRRGRADGALLVGDAAGRILRRDLATGTRDAARHAARRRAAVSPRRGRRARASRSCGGRRAMPTPRRSASSIPSGTLRVIEEIATDYEGGLAASRTHARLLRDAQGRDRGQPAAVPALGRRQADRRARRHVAGRRHRRHPRRHAASCSRPASSASTSRASAERRGQPPQVVSQGHVARHQPVPRRRAPRDRHLRSARPTARLAARSRRHATHRAR